MDHPPLSFDERQALARNGWFSSLSASLRHDILRCGVARRWQNGERIFEKGRVPAGWCAVIRGAARVGLTSPGGQKLTLCYMRPGSWFSALTVLQSTGSDYDADALGSTTLLTVGQDDLRGILRQHEELYGALLRLHARRTRQVYELIEDIMSLPLRARLAKQLVRLAASHGAPVAAGIRIRLPLRQEDMAQLLGASRQRVNKELMTLRRDGVVKVERGELVVCDGAALQRIAEGQQADAPAWNRPVYPRQDFWAQPQRRPAGTGLVAA